MFYENVSWNSFWTRISPLEHFRTNHLQTYGLKLSPKQNRLLEGEHSIDRKLTVKYQEDAFFLPVQL